MLYASNVCFTIDQVYLLFNLLPIGSLTRLLFIIHLDYDQYQYIFVSYVNNCTKLQRRVTSCCIADRASVGWLPNIAHNLCNPLPVAAPLRTWLFLLLPAQTQHDCDSPTPLLVNRHRIGNNEDIR